MPKNKIDCSDLAALIANRLFLAAGYPGVNTVEKAVIKANEFTETPLTQEVGFDSLVEFLHVERVNARSNVDKNVNNLIKEEGIFRRLKTKLKELRQLLADGVDKSDPERVQRAVSSLITLMKSQAKELGTQQRLDEKIRNTKIAIRKGDVAPNKKQTKEGSKQVEKMKRKLKEFIRIKSLLHQINVLSAKLESGDVMPTPKEVKLRSFLAARLEKQRDKLKSQIEQRIRDQEPDGWVWRTWDNVNQELKPILASADASFSLIQGIKFAVTHPIKWTIGTAKGVTAIFNQRMADAVDRAIENDPLFPVLQDAAPGLLPTDLEIADGVEMRKAILEKLPHVGRIPKFFREWIGEPSGRGWKTAVKYYRFNLFKAMAQGWAIAGVPTQAEAEMFANYTGAATGRGGPVGKGDNSKSQKAFRIMDRIVFSARNLAAAAQYIVGQPIWRGFDLKDFARQPINFWRENPSAMPKVRAYIIAEYARTYMGMAALAFMWEQIPGNDEVEKVPFKRDFMVLKRGNTRWTIDSPTQSVARVIGSMAKGTFFDTVEQTFTRKKAKKEKGEITPLTSYGLGRAQEGKASPVMSILFNLATGRLFAGEPTTADKLVLKNITPISLQEVVEDMRDKDVPEFLIQLVIKLAGGNIGESKYKDKGRSRPTRRSRTTRP